MTARLTLESARGNIDLDGIAKFGKGVQVQSGVTGLGLPLRDVQYYEGAGDGATFRSARTLPRDIDLPLVFDFPTREELKTAMSQFSRVLSGDAVLRWQDDAEVGSWTVQVRHVGGGDYGGDDMIGDGYVFVIVTLRAGDPYWTRSYENVTTIASGAGGRGLLNGSLSALRVSPGQTIGAMVFNNDGDADAFPTWKILGPGTNLTIRNPQTSQQFRWLGTLAAGQRLTIDTKAGTVIDGTGANRYADLDTAPLFWRVPPGITNATVSMDAASSGSSIEALWRPRKWLVI